MMRMVTEGRENSQEHYFEREKHVLHAPPQPDSHDASLELASVQQTIAKARPLIAGFGARATTTPVGGIGLS